VLFAGRDFDLEVERLRRYLVPSRYPALTTRTRKMMSVSQVVLLVLFGAPVLLATSVSLWRAVA
jgi:inhibitor of KinA sporulation pathway (predicted exonuclease)